MRPVATPALTALAGLLSRLLSRLLATLPAGLLTGLLSRLLAARLTRLLAGLLGRLLAGLRSRLFPVLRLSRSGLAATPLSPLPGLLALARLLPFAGLAIRVRLTGLRLLVARLFARARLAVG